MSRRPRSRRPPLLSDRAPAPTPTGTGGPAIRARTPRDQLVAAKVAGPHPHFSRESVLQRARSLVRGEPRTTFGLVEPGAVDLDGVRAAIAASHGYRFDTPRASIDPDATLRCAEHATTRLFEIAAAGGRIAFATGRPSSLLVHYQQLARVARHAGAEVVAFEQYGPFRAAGRGDRFCRWLDGVAVVTDEDSLLADDGFECGDEWLFAVGRVDLAVADRGFAAAMLRDGIETVAFADLDAVALSVAASRGRPAHVVPLVETRPPTAYAPLDGLVAFLAGMAGAAPDQASHSTTQAPETYARPSSGESEG
ncbi:MAG TPA: phosphatase [Acidimicrobiia bacterium]|nr:phosphatase [Acidimicrobiia bacterium]